MSIELCKVSYVIHYDAIEFVPNGMETAVEKLVWKLPHIDALHDYGNGYLVEIEYEGFEKIGRVQYEIILKKLVDTIESICVEYENFIKI